MTTPTAPPTSEPVEVPPPSYYAIELDPLAPPAGTGLEGWGDPLAEPVTICRQGQTVETVELGLYQSAVAGLDGNSLGSCQTPAVTVAGPATPAPQAPVPQVAVPQSLPVTGTSELVQVSVAGSLLLIGVALLRLTRRSA